MHLWIVCLPPLLPGNCGKVERDFFISQQKVAPGVGNLPTPVLISTLEYTEIYLVQFSWKAFICVHNGYLHFTHRQSNSLCWPREFDYLYHYNISPRLWRTMVQVMLQDHSPWVKGLLATQLRGIAMMIWQTAYPILDSRFSTCVVLDWGAAQLIFLCVIANTSPQKNDLCTEELWDRA